MIKKGQDKEVEDCVYHLEACHVEKVQRKKEDLSDHEPSVLTLLEVQKYNFLKLKEIHTQLKICLLVRTTNATHYH